MVYHVPVRNNKKNGGNMHTSMCYLIVIRLVITSGIFKNQYFFLYIFPPQWAEGKGRVR